MTIPTHLIAELDQAQAGEEGRAKLVAAFFNGLLDEGLERAECLELTRDYLETEPWQDEE